MDINNIDIVKYNDKHKHIWDDFIETNCFGTLYHTRNFLSYHPNDRFQDESILIYYTNELICIVPACKKKDNYFSYTGATYGGPVISKKYIRIKYLKTIVDTIFKYYKNKIEFRIANNIYFSNSIHTLYFLISQKLTIYPELSWYINTNDNFIDNITNKRNKARLKKSINNKAIICNYFDNDTDYKSFYKILKQNLEINHNSSPTHTLDEFLKLKILLDKKQRLYLVKENNNILGGVFVLKVTKQCWYTFYITRNIELDKVNCSVSYLMYQISIDAKKENVKYIDYGISTEEKGKLINEGLSDFKQSSLGGVSNYRYLFLLN